MQRRIAGQASREDDYITGSPAEPSPDPIQRWQAEVHIPGVYDLEVDTSRPTPARCAALVLKRLGAARAGPTAFEQMAAGYPSVRSAG